MRYSGLTSEEVRLDSRELHEVFCLLKTVGRALEQSSGGVKFLTHFYPVQTLRMSVSIPTRVDIAHFLVVLRKNFTSVSFVGNKIAREEN